MIDPQKLMAFVQRENGIKPMAAPVAPGEEELMDEEALEEGEEPGEEEPSEEAEISDEEIEEIVELIEAGEGDPVLMQLSAELAEEIEEFGEEAERPPIWATSPDVWEKAETAVDPEGKGKVYMEPYAVVAHVYMKLGGTVA